MTQIDVWPLFSRLSASINEGHTGMGFPMEISSGLKSGLLKVFPFAIKEFDGKHLIVRYNLSSNVTLQPGDRITKINGIPVTTLANMIISGIGGLPTWKNIRLASSIGIYLALYKINSPYTIDFVNATGNQQITVEAVLRDSIRARIAAIRKVSNNVKSQLYTFERLENNIGYINFRSMDKINQFDSFLQNTFTDIQKEKVKGLIIDLRENGGGNSYLGDRLLQHIIDKPFRMDGGSIWKVSQEYKNHLKSLDSNRLKNIGKPVEKYMAMNNGEVIQREGDKLKSDGKGNPLRYQGKVCFLIGPNTFSSANMLAGTVKDYKLATLIGEPTGEPGNDYGEVYPSSLPHTKLGFFTSTTLWIRPNGDAKDPNPILPDYFIKSTDPTKDEVLQFAKDWIMKN